MLHGYAWELPNWGELLAWVELDLQNLTNIFIKIHEKMVFLIEMGSSCLHHAL